MHAAKSLQSCPTLCDPIDGSPSGSPVPGILQARTLEWVAISFSSAGSEKWKWSRSVVSDPQRPHGLQPSRLLHPWDFPGKSTGVGCHCLLCKWCYKIIKHVSSLTIFITMVSSGFEPRNLIAFPELENLCLENLIFDRISQALWNKRIREPIYLERFWICRKSIFQRLNVGHHGEEFKLKMIYVFDGVHSCLCDFLTVGSVSLQPVTAPASFLRNWRPPTRPPPARYVWLSGHHECVGLHVVRWEERNLIFKTSIVDVKWLQGQRHLDATYAAYCGWHSMC